MGPAALKASLDDLRVLRESLQALKEQMHEFNSLCDGGFMKSMQRISLNKEASNKFGNQIKACIEQRSILKKAVVLINDIK
jgi:hypothetical protein